MPSVVHLHVPSATLGSGSASLFQGSLSDYYLSKLKQGEVPDSLAARQLPVVSWRSASELVVAPILPLAAGPYSLVAVSGLLGEFQVATERPLLRRVWPASGAGGSLRFAVYCGDGASVPSGGSVVLQPGELTVALSPGVDAEGALADHCLHFKSDVELAPEQIVVPPPASGAWALDPSPFSAPSTQPALALSCEQAEIGFGLGCAVAADDRATIRTPQAPLLWVVHSARGAFVEVTRDGASFVARGLFPGRREHLWGSVHDATGAQLGFDLFVATLMARARPVLNEVLADALGPEPQSEWIELVNDGSLALDLSGYQLQDGGGLTALPSALIGPQEYALLVRDDFAPNASDVPPAPGVQLIRVPTLGKSGLSNGGERLALLDSAGQECSVVPALPAKPGQSLARRHPWSLDADPDAFGFGPPSPGTANDAPIAK